MERVEDWLVLAVQRADSVKQVKDQQAAGPIELVGQVIAVPVWSVVE